MGILVARVRLAGAVLLVALGAARTPAAQRAGGVEVGAFASLASFTPGYDLRAGVGGGVRVGYFLRPAWAIELEGGAERATPEGGGSSVPITLAAVHVLFNFGDESPSWYLLGGYARPRFGGTPPGRFGDDAVTLGVGGRIFLGHRLALRADVRGLYSFSSSLPPGNSAGHMLATLGLSYFTVGGPPPDADQDGVRDARDACPNTPMGAIVDRRGCPSDSDADGHYNGLDHCPNTPFGAFADAQGCPVDSDGDAAYDGHDQCPNTPTGSAVDPRGCPLDADADGVDDARDRCPNTPADLLPVDESGCPKDGDRDGVPDSRDRCPDTPPGTAVDAVVCPTATDADGDGVDDTRDK
ncbi:MAG: thrombospondin type 3 repeat-containing protein, partial [Gemmatimonadales bacterium]